MIIQANVRYPLPLADKSVHCVVTSPPYWGLRDYGTDGQIGLERTPAEYIDRMVGVFREARRVLRDDGTCWLNIGDSYASSPGKHNANLMEWVAENAKGGGRRVGLVDSPSRSVPSGLKPKDLVGIPWMLAFALRADGWYLRSEIIWAKPNPMPESVRDRPTKAHETVFLLTKSERYFFDQEAVREASAPATLSRDKYTRITSGKDGDYAVQHDHETPSNPNGRNLRSVWSISTKPFRGSHFATMPVDLAERCIKAGTSERGVCPECGSPYTQTVERERLKAATPSGMREPGRWSEKQESGVGGRCVVRSIGWEPSCPCPAADPIPARVFDPFGGAMTTILAARRLGRIGIATEISAEYIAIGRARLMGGLDNVSGKPMADEPLPMFAAWEGARS